MTGNGGHRHLAGEMLFPLGDPSHRLWQQHESKGDKQAGQASDKKCDLPSLDDAEQRNRNRLCVGDGSDDHCADHERHAGADCGAQAVDAHGEAEPALREAVRDDRIGGR